MSGVEICVRVKDLTSRVACAVCQFLLCRRVEESCHDNARRFCNVTILRFSRFLARARCNVR